MTVPNTLIVLTEFGRQESENKGLGEMRTFLISPGVIRNQIHLI